MKECDIDNNNTTTIPSSTIVNSSLLTSSSKKSLSSTPPSFFRDMSSRRSDITPLRDISRSDKPPKLSPPLHFRKTSPSPPTNERPTMFPFTTKSYTLSAKKRRHLHDTNESSKQSRDTVNRRRSGGEFRFLPSPPSHYLTAERSRTSSYRYSPPVCACYDCENYAQPPKLQPLILSHGSKWQRRSDSEPCSSSKRETEEMINKDKKDDDMD